MNAVTVLTVGAPLEISLALARVDGVVLVCARDMHDALLRLRDRDADVVLITEGVAAHDPVATGRLVRALDGSAVCVALAAANGDDASCVLDPFINARWWDDAPAVWFVVAMGALAETVRAYKRRIALTGSLPPSGSYTRTALFAHREIA
jgi:hypothetical protein